MNLKEVRHEEDSFHVTDGINGNIMCCSKQFYTEVQAPSYFAVDYPAGSLDVYVETSFSLATNERIALSSVYPNPIWAPGPITVNSDEFITTMHQLLIPYLENQTNETREAYLRIDLEKYYQGEWHPLDFFYLHVYQFGAIIDPDDNDIQIAINNAENGDTVNIPAGDFVGHLTISNKDNLTIKGAGFGSTTISSQGHKSTIAINSCTNLKTNLSYT